MPTINDTYPAWLPAMKWLLTPFRAAGYSVKKDHTTKFDALPSVSYDKLRHTIRNGDLLFCGGDYAFSKTIRYLSGQSKVSHVGIVYWWNERLMLLESVETDGVRIVPVSQYVENYENRGAPYNGRIYLARDQRVTIAPTNRKGDASGDHNPMVEEILHFAASLLNKKFSFKDVLTFLWQGNTGRELHVDDEEFLCSEFVAKCFRKVSIAYPDDGHGFIAPEHIAMSEHVQALVEIQTK